MLLVTFHGGSKGINNVYAYNPDGSRATKTALDEPTDGKLSELRALVLANGLLYVANGAKSQSTVLAYTVPDSGTSFTDPSIVIGPTLSKKGHFETSIAHPFGIAFDGSTCFVSNQDTNVVSQIAMSSNGLTGSLGEGCQSPYLSKLFPAGIFLDGTYVASQVGILPDVELVTTVVDHAHGGQGVSFDSGKVKNSVRDVAVANGLLFVCDEPEKVVDMYSLADGSYLGSSNALAESPTHLAIDNGGLYVSAGSTLNWGPLPPSPSSAALALQPITPTPPASKAPLKIGGISFDDGSPATVYIPYQTGTGGSQPGGLICSYSVSQQQPSAPVLSDAAVVVASLDDTPEFVLYWSGGA